MRTSFIYAWSNRVNRRIAPILFSQNCAQLVCRRSIQSCSSIKAIVMAPKAGAKQVTLGKFFGQPNGSKSAPQQSKLAFSTKAKTVKTEEDESLDNSVVKEEQDVKEEKDDTPMSDADERASTAASPTSSDDLVIPTSKKRSVKDEESDIASDDEIAPPAKKQRKRAPTVSKVSPKKPRGKKADEQPAGKATSAKASIFSRSAKDSEPKGKKGKAAKPKSTKAEEIDEDDEVAPPKKRHQVIDEEQSSVEEDLEEDLEEEEEEEAEQEKKVKPKAATKSRQKAQTAAQSITKDPYPDWKAGDPVPFAALCTTFSLIEMTTKRLEILAHCGLFLRQVLRLSPDDALPTVLLMVNKLAADYSGIELGIGESLIMKAIGESTGRNLAQIKSDQKEIGDLGLVAAKSRAGQRAMFKPKQLTVRGVHEGLMGIATIEGTGSQGRKVAGIQKLLSAADLDGKAVDITKNKGGPSEAKYIVRMLEGKLRLGLAEKTVLVAVAQAMVHHEILEKTNKPPNSEQLEKGETIMKAVYNELPSYEVIIPATLEHGVLSLRDHIKLQPGIPLKPMLAKPTKSITEVLDRFEGKQFTCEYKYDGERAQIHFVAHDAPQQFQTAVPQAGKSEKGIANIFSRNSEDLSKKYPDILAKLPTWVKDGTQSFVLDCETVAWDVDEKKVLPFQQLMTRKRKDVKTEDIKVKVCVFAFDLLFLNGEALVNKSFRERREKLKEAFVEVEGEFTFAKFGNTDQLEEIQVLLDDSVKASCEGLMVKMLDGVESHYEPSRRSQNWLKVKKDYLSGVGDSLDLVVIGAYYGKGKRTSVYGAFQLACWNPSTEHYETVCNIGTGFSEAILEEFHRDLKEIVIDRPKPFYSHASGNTNQPDVWFEPKFVWEVKIADLTLSPKYKAAADEVNSGGKGVSLRFPRFIHKREDKKADQATTSRQVAEMYQKQESVAKNKGPSVDDDFEY